MLNLYDRIQEGLINLRAMPTSKLEHLAQDSQDQRVRDMIGDILMYERTSMQGRKRVITEWNDGR